MRHVNYTNVYAALRKAYDSDLYEHVNDEWMAGFDCFGRAVLYDDYHHIRTGTIIGCTSMTDLLRYATQLLMREYRSRPWYELGEREYDAFLSATSFFRHGEPKAHWKQLFSDMEDGKLDEIWRMAFWHEAEGKAPDNWREAA